MMEIEKKNILKIITLWIIALFFIISSNQVAAQTVSTFITGSGLNGPDGFALDELENLYVANWGNGFGNNVLKITGNGEVSTFASGFSAPDGLVFDNEGNLYVSNFASGIINKVSPDGIKTVFASGLNNPSSLQFDVDGNLYVSNHGNGGGTTVSKITADGIVSTFATGFSAPLGLVFNTAGDLFVSNYNTGIINKISPSGVVSIFASISNDPMALLQYLSFDANGNLYVPSYGHNRIYKINPEGRVSVFAGSFSAGGTNGHVNDARFDGPNSIAITSTGIIYVSEYNTNRIRKILPEGFTDQNLLNNPESAVYDPATNSYLISNFGDGNIISIDSEGKHSYFNQELNSAAGLFLIGDTLFALDNQGQNPGLTGILLSSGQKIFNLNIPGMMNLNDITSDNTGNLYITDTDANRIYKVRISDMSYTVFVNSGLVNPDGIFFDQSNKRLLVLNSGAAGMPITAVNLEDSTLSTVVNTGIEGLDGIAMDNDGNYYVSSWVTDIVYRFDNLFAMHSEVIAEGYNDPGDIYFDKINDVLVVPDFFTNNVDFIPINITIREDMINYGQENKNPLQIYPNPFINLTNITFELIDNELVKLEIFNLCGQNIKTLVNSKMNHGKHTIIWDGTNNNGNIVVKGIYLCKLLTVNKSAIMKIFKGNNKG